ncbi:hypothetical protein BS50DRAFT_239851 [Corynespora cassiicola Philippines]|uniref:Uncharacterized protein n=1 Tax=Corynespora cassiicola Philippines TaxID=1448308 RepID=A0A2T2P2P1_CORCC|nr:hypothetical protein BS50DRAFT_239851 [Corynespora cassiicola Philippines]
MDLWKEKWGSRGLDQWAGYPRDRASISSCFWFRGWNMGFFSLSFFLRLSRLRRVVRLTPFTPFPAREKWKYKILEDWHYRWCHVVLHSLSGPDVFAFFSLAQSTFLVLSSTLDKSLDITSPAKGLLSTQKPIRTYLFC